MISLLTNSSLVALGFHHLIELVVSAALQSVERSAALFARCQGQRGG